MPESTILFVDDQKEILFLIKRMLKGEPYNLLYANNGQEALAIIENEKVDVLVTDVLMPQMNGLELLEKVKESHPNIVRIILSGFSQIPTLLSAINDGKIFKYITKPWQVDEEAKRILRDAVEYSKLISNKHTLLMDDFCDFLQEKKEIFLITVENIIIFVHPELKNIYTLNTPYEMRVSENHPLIQEYSLSSTQKVYLFK